MLDCDANKVSLHSNAQLQITREPLQLPLQQRVQHSSSA